MVLVGVYGASGCGRSLMPVVRADYPNAELVFIDDLKRHSTVNGYRLLKWSQFCEWGAGRKRVVIAVADSQTRQKLMEKCGLSSIGLASVRAASVVLMDDVVIGEGACLSPFVTIASNVTIGTCFHANLYSYVEHDCVVGDFVTMAPGAKVNGNVIVGNHAYIGSNAVIRQGINIGDGSVVGMGAVVVKDVPANSTVVGNPARVVEA